MAEYIYPAPGVTGVEATLTIHRLSKAADDAGMVVPSLQDITLNASNDVFTWTQLDAAAKKQIATTATNSLGMNLVLNQAKFFGEGFTTVAAETNLPTSGLTVGEIYFATAEGTFHTAATTGTFDNDTGGALAKGILGLSTDKTLVQFDLYFGDESDGTAGKYISGTGYVTGLAPTVSADAPVWVSPITITVDSDYTISDTALA